MSFELPQHNDRLQEVLRYAGISVLALGVDAGLMALLIAHAGWPAVPASAIGFAAGTLVAYQLASTWAFRGHVHRHGVSGWVAFSFIGVGGLCINSVFVWLGIAMLGLGWPVAKLGAAAGSFIFNYAVRKAVLYPSALESRP